MAFCRTIIKCQCWLEYQSNRISYSICIFYLVKFVGVDRRWSFLSFVQFTGCSCSAQKHLVLMSFQDQAWTKLSRYQALKHCWVIALTIIGSVQFGDKVFIVAQSMSPMHLRFHMLGFLNNHIKSNFYVDCLITIYIRVHHKPHHPYTVKILRATPWVQSTMYVVI